LTSKSDLCIKRVTSGSESASGNPLRLDGTSIFGFDYSVDYSSIVVLSGRSKVVAEKFTPHGIHHTACAPHTGQHAGGKQEGCCWLFSKRIKIQRVGDPLGSEPIQHNGIFGKSPECALLVVKAVCRLLALDYDHGGTENGHLNDL